MKDMDQMTMKNTQKHVFPGFFLEKSRKKKRVNEY